ncbi:MAG: hypothetical protein U0792_10370 [Gemmataceae bacterium]
MAAFVCVAMLLAIPIGLMIGAAILRGAVSLANACLGPDRSKTSYYDDEFTDYERRYERPSRRYQETNTGGLIPEPGLGYGMVIVLVNAFAQFAVGVVMAIGLMAVAGGAGGGQGFGAGKRGFGDGDGGNDAMALMMNLLSIPVGFIVTSGVLTMMLPTSFGRACLVTLFQYLIMIAIGVVIFVVLLAAVGGVQGLKR